MREQFSQVTAFIDGSVIYDQDEESAMRLVDPETGLLLNHVTESGVELLPKIRMVDIGGEQTAVFTAGDPRYFLPHKKEIVSFRNFDSSAEFWRTLPSPPCMFCSLGSTTGSQRRYYITIFIRYPFKKNSFPR